MAGFNWYPTHSNTDHHPCALLGGCGGGSASTGSQVPLCSLADVQLRFLCPNDLDEVRALCQDWFPIDYPLSWYEDITSSNRFFALAAVYNQIIVGLIVAEIKPFSKLNSEDKDILPKIFMKTAEVGYILSLGVTKQFRRNGIASLLLDAFIGHLTTTERGKVKAIFLHVLSSNTTAIKFYEHRRFHLHKFLPYYYSIRGRCKDGFTYVLYINGGHPPWGFYDYIKYWCDVAWNAGGICSWLGGKIVNVLHWLWPTPHKVSIPSGTSPQQLMSKSLAHADY